MRHLEKLWTVVYKITEAIEITPSGKPCRIPSKTLWPVVCQQDSNYIFEKLEKDDKVIEIIQMPDSLDYDPSGNAECYLFNILPSFKKYCDQLYAKYSFDVDKVSDGNIIKLLDVALDIKEKLELTDESKVKIPLMPSIIKFQGLMPRDGINFRDQYCEYRWDSLNYFKKINVIANLLLLEGGHRWESKIKIEVNRLDFDKLLEKLQERHKEISQKTEKIEIQSQIAKKDGAKAEDINKITKDDISSQENNVVYEIKFSKNREITINGILISTPDFNSENELFFDLVYKQPNQRISRKQIEKHIGNKLKKPIQNIIRDLGFTGELAKVFFNASQKGVLFRNPISESLLDELKIKIVKIKLP